MHWLEVCVTGRAGVERIGDYPCMSCVLHMMLVSGIALDVGTDMTNTCSLVPRLLDAAD